MSNVSRSMRIHIASIAIAFCLSCQTVWADKCADTLRALAKRTKSFLRTAEFDGLCAALAKNEITYSKETGGFIDPDEKDVPLELRARDLNRDGAREVFVHAQSRYWGGAKGDVLWLFVRNRAPRSPYRTNLGFSSDGYTVLQQTYNGYPYIRVFPRAVCSAIWQWNGTDYAHACNIPETPNGCPDGRPICTEQLTSHSTEPARKAAQAGEFRR